MGDDVAQQMFDSAADFGLDDFEANGISETLFARVYRKWNAESCSSWQCDPMLSIVDQRAFACEVLSELFEKHKVPTVNGLHLAHRLNRMPDLDDDRPRKASVLNYV